MTNKLQSKNWRKVKLGEIAGVLGGFAFKSEWFNNRKIGFPAIKIQNITDGLVDVASAEYIDTAKVKRDISKFRLQKGDFLVAMTGATAGKVGLLTQETPCYLNQRVGKFYPKNEGGLDKKYLYYSVINPKNLNLLKKLADGSAQGNMSSSQIEGILEISLPENLAEQKRIAEILSAFDDKIELNDKISRTLEEMAQAIFKEWFNKSSKLKVQSSKLKGKEAENAEDIFVFEKGIEPGSRYYSETRKDGYIPFYRVRDLDKQGGVDVYIPEKITQGKFCKEEDVLLSLDATVGRVKIGCRGAFSSGIRKVYSRDNFIKSSFIYFWLKTPYVQNTIIEHASGTTILHAGTSIQYLKFPFNKEAIAKIQEKVNPLFVKILQTIKENQALGALRDLLLPKLMSGEVRV